MSVATKDADWPEARGAAPTWIKSDSLAARGTGVVALILALLIPAAMVGGLVDERSARYADVAAQLAREWGGSQSVVGPVLLVPTTVRTRHTKRIVAESGEVREVHQENSTTRTVVVLPDRLRIDAELSTATRRRSVFEVIVYRSAIHMSGTVLIPEPLSSPDANVDVHWDQAAISLGVSGPVGIQSATLQVDAREIAKPEPGTSTELLKQGVHWRLPSLTATRPPMDFELDLAVNGSNGIQFAPLGGSTSVDVRSSWPHPGFSGIAPKSSAISDTGFEASWAISNLASDFARIFNAGQPEIEGAPSVGVSLVQPVFLYSLLERAVKYAVLFVTLTFATLLIFELQTRARAHFVQYALIGAALVLFYLLLLALSEHVGFGVAYAVSAVAVVVMIAAYVAAALDGWRGAAHVSLMLTATYAILYVTLQLEDFALLTGTIALFLALGLLMYFTRTLRVNPAVSPDS